jgi:hypothetical protein
MATEPPKKKRKHESTEAAQKVLSQTIDAYLLAETKEEEECA